MGELNIFKLKYPDEVIVLSDELVRSGRAHATKGTSASKPASILHTKDPYPPIHDETEFPGTHRGLAAV